MPKYGIRVKDIMEKKFLVIKPTHSIQKVAKIMHENHRSGVLILDDLGCPIGIVTLKDMVYKGLVKGIDPKTTKISVIMSKNLISIEPDEDLSKAVKKMREWRIRRLPVVKNKKLVGYITESELSKLSPNLLETMIEKLKVLEPSFRLKVKRG
ncbi:MAG TPA: CBS domain-containing protein [Candidatus Woesearchaeota archaeon]|nr:CBS domain-containing protein [Candidatus Woesearchaeota archaeon]